MPSTKKSAPRNRKPSPPKSPTPPAAQQLAPCASDVLDPLEEQAPAPAPAAVETAPPSAPASATEPAPGASEEPAVAEDIAPVEDAAEDVAEEAPVAEQVAAVDPDPEPQHSPAASNGIRLGHVEGVLHRVPVSAVQSILADSQDRIEVLKTSAQVLALHSRVRATEGRCAPIIFSMEEGAERPHILAGLEAFAAALNVELSHVYVITVAAEDAGGVQSFLAHQANNKPADGSEEDLIRQVLSYDD